MPATKRQSAAYWRAQGRVFRPDANLPDIGGAVVEGPSLHPDTDPEAIADTQRADVAWCLMDRMKWADDPFDLEAISAEVVLCRWIVWRRLTELWYVLPEPAPVRASSGKGGAKPKRHDMQLPSGNR